MTRRRHSRVKWISVGTTADVSRMRLVGGNLALDFLNTRAGTPGAGATDDVLSSYAELVSWARYAGALDAECAGALQEAARRTPAPANDTWQRSLILRDTLESIFRPISAGQRPDDAALERLATDETEALAAARVVSTPGSHEPAYEWTWGADASLHRPLREVVHSATQLLMSASLARLKGCAGCKSLFIDESKNRSRRWCSMEDCGTTQKVRRYVAARRARTNSPASH
ncbi:hypothetical protein F6B41_01460 [Microbacterium lushaniae]|nr:hypothetical protein F6B41_02165 [Microbacterium lushaniae]KAA9159146.1 hypothetical protein F6B41_01460 [Microbacterium lushaniae]